MPFTTGNDTNILQGTDTGVVGAGDGDDIYIIGGGVGATQTIGISDGAGMNVLWLPTGLAVASSLFAADAAQLTLSNGAVININGASSFSYRLGGDPISVTGGVIQSYSDFVTISMGALAVPTGLNTEAGGANTGINADGSTSSSGGTGGTRDDFASNITTIGSVAIGGTTAGNIETVNDVDWFATTLQAGHTYKFDLEGSPTNKGTLNDTFFRGVYDANGNFIIGTTDDDAGVQTNSQLSFTPTTTGTYYVAAGAYTNYIGTYQLSVIEQNATPTAGNDDFSGDVTTIGAVAVGGSVAGNIEVAGDADWFAITLSAGSSYTFDLEGSPTNKGTLGDPFLHGVYDANGVFIVGTSNDDGGTQANSQVNFSPSTTGVYYISAAAYDANIGTYQLSVSQVATVPTNTGDFNIVINYTGDAAYRVAFTNAASRWEQVITADLPDVSTGAAFIDDLLIEASVKTIDGVNGILGQAGPREFRDGGSGGLPYAGVMEFDSADIALMAQNGTLENVILHEMGHVLGVGTLWDSFFPSNNPLSGQYQGVNALREYRLLIGDSTASFVPVETDGGSGTAGGHWDEDTFRDELMTGYASAPGVGSPLSRMTVGIMDDLGYTVDYNAADVYTMPTNLVQASILDFNADTLWLI